MRKAPRKTTKSPSAWAPVPRYRGTTVLGLLYAVQRAVLAEPKRANMSMWRRSMQTAYPTRHAAIRGGGERAATVPACGTVGCLAGWLAILTNQPGGDRQTESLALHVLGPDLLLYDIPVHDTYGRFVATCAYVFNEGMADITAPPHTAAHARQIARRIDAFIAHNAVALKGRRLGGRVA